MKEEKNNYEKPELDKHKNLNEVTKGMPIGSSIPG